MSLYEDDCDFVVDEAVAYAASVTLSGTGKDIWIFDVSDAALSCLPYYSASVQFGALPFNRTGLNEWTLTEQATAVPGVLRLYNAVLGLGIEVVFLTGIRGSYSGAIASNLRKVGFYKWMQAYFRNDNDQHSTKEFKDYVRTSLVETEGYVIVGSISDQWRDLKGPYTGNRTFKLPNPMYLLPETRIN